jgi:hypothetical protein
MGKLDMGIVDTRPGGDKGGSGAFTPPHGWSGSKEDYVLLLKDRYKDLMYGQRMFSQAKHYKRSNGDIQYIGPFAKVAEKVLQNYAINL